MKFPIENCWSFGTWCHSQRKATESSCGSALSMLKSWSFTSLFNLAEKKKIVHQAKIEQQHYSLSKLLSLQTWCPTEPWAHTWPTLPGKPFLRAHPARPQPQPRIIQSTCLPVMKAWLIARLLAKQTQYLPQLHKIRIFFFYCLNRLRKTDFPRRDWRRHFVFSDAPSNQTSPESNEGTRFCKPPAAA